MARYKVTCSYDGFDFLGWEKQVTGRTIQGEIEKALSTILNTPTNIVASGRTDAKVHSLGQVFHFESDKDLNLEKFRFSLNQVLPDDIHIISIAKVDDNFHARISATGKHYRYILNQGETDPFNIRYINQLNRKLDTNKMIEASKLFMGTHDFKNFTSKEEDNANFVRTISDLNININNDLITFDFYGDGFMRYEIRMIVGTLIEIGLGKITSDFIKENLDCMNRKIVSYKASGNGLYLVEVMY